MSLDGDAAFLQQAHRNNWRQYLESLKPSSDLGWDICVLTASDEQQADAYKQQLDLRRSAGLLPAGTYFVVIPDPGGRRTGSGGATLHALQTLSSEAAKPLAASKVLIIHSGGDSRRLPHCSAIGKLFARIPRTLPDGRASTLFDEFLVSLSGIPQRLPPGVLVASGDVLLVFDHLQLDLRRPGVIGVAAAAPAQMGTHHGVYVTEGHGRLRAYLHKPSPAQMEAWSALGPDGQVQIDTGLVWLDQAMTQHLIELAQMGIAQGAILNLYADLLLPLAQSTALDAYLADASDGPATPELRAARQVIWQRLRGAPFTVQRLHPARFVHFGTTREYWHLCTGEGEFARACGWERQSAAYLSPSARTNANQLVLINACVQGTVEPGTGPALLVDSHLQGPLHWAKGALAANVNTQAGLALEADMAIHQLPVQGGFVTRLYGLLDNPKLSRDDPDATIMNAPWATWLADAGLSPDLLWPDLPQAEWSLWNAKLYPVVDDREASLRLSLPLQAPQNAGTGWRQKWQESHRLSLGESFAQAKTELILEDQTEIRDQVCAHAFMEAINDQRPADQAMDLLGAASADRARQCALAVRWLADLDPITRLRFQMALALATDDRSWERRAFATLAESIAQATPARRRVAHQAAEAKQRIASARVEAAARIDFGGGWTDTPPYSLERGGTVLNAAITLNGRLPIVAEARWLSQPGLILECKDIELTLQPEQAGEVLACADPSDPFALPKAALVLHGLVPEDCDPQMPVADLARHWEAGLHLSTQSSIPRGSGLGTSSILAGAVLTALADLLGQPLTQGEMFDQVLCLEQMMTTGGGWQDQVGGLVGGIKLITSAPGLPQQVQVEEVPMSPETTQSLSQRLALIYTGQQRLAKDLLQRVMRRWMLREPEMVAIQQGIAQLALAMRDALQTGDITRFGELIAEHWTLNKRMNPDCSNPFIDELFAFLGPCIHGAKLAGAGGGGFALLVAQEGALPEMTAALDKAYAGTHVAVWPSTIPAQAVRRQVARR